MGSVVLWVLVFFLPSAAFGAGLSRTLLASYLPAFFAAGALCIVASLLTLAISPAPKPVVAAAAAPAAS